MNRGIMKRFLIPCIFFCAAAGEAATIWQEDFSSYTNAGITGQGATNYPAAITNWTIDVSSCTTLNPGSGSAADYFLAVPVSGGRMEAANIKGEAVWSSAVVPISGYTNVALSVATSENGSSASTNKYVKLFYRLNGGTETAFAINAFNVGNWTNALAVQSNLYGSTVQLIARVNNPNTGDKTIFDNVTVTGDPLATLPTAPAWSIFYNLPQQSSSGTVYPDQFRIRDALLARINELQAGHSATLATFTFSADEGAGAIINALSLALDRGALIRFIADNEAATDIQYGGTNTLRELSARAVNPLFLVIDDDAGGIMHHKFGLFNYGGSDQRVFTASWNFTLAASANQWNIAIDVRSPALYAAYQAEAAELLAGRFHDHSSKSHAHDRTLFELNGAWGANAVRFAPYPDALLNGNNAETDMLNLIAGAQDKIVFALNKLNRISIRDALIAAANRGVSIQGVIPKSDTLPGGVSAAVYDYLINPANYSSTNTVQFLTLYATADYSATDSAEPDLVHAKVMVIDPDSDRAAAIHGSPNWTSGGLTSTFSNDENLLIFRHREIAAEFYLYFQRITGTGRFAKGNSLLAEWNFEDGDVTADGGSAANAGRTVRRVPIASATNFISGTLSVNGWDNGANIKYWETDFSTLQHTNISVSSKQTSTSTGPAHFKLQYKTASAAIYQDVPAGSIPVGTGWGGQLTRLLLPPACNNQTNVFLRWVMTGNTAVNGSTVSSSGASRIDDLIISGNAYNLPPVINPVANQEVFEGQPLSFSVTASDPIDGDPFYLSAAGLPTGAVFTNGVFIWNQAAPTGLYTVTFFAADKDGTNSRPVTITVSRRPQVLLSEIADPAGTGGDAFRFVELYNAGTEPIHFAEAQWFLCRQVNGGTAWSDIALTGTVAAAGTYLIAKNRDDFFHAYGFYPQQESSGADGNGDDAYFLFRGGNHTNGLLIDAFGEPDINGKDTIWEYTDSRAVRLDAVCQPSSVWPPQEWLIIPDAETSGMTPGRHGALPVFAELPNPFVFTGDDLFLAVSAVNTVSTDVITLSASTLPPGALFTPTTGVNQVGSPLRWSKPPEGIYRIAFSAAGANGTNTAAITVTVSSRSGIAGKFYGWSGDTIFKLDNGQFWQQIVSGSKTVPVMLRPGITITNVTGQRRMFVSGVSGYAVVAPLAVTESSVTNGFTGLHNLNCYQLADGTTWKQISFENIPCAASPVTVWRWMKNGQQMLRFLDHNDAVIGTCTAEVSAPPVNPPVVSSIDGYFRGWQRQRIFALANGQFWQQTSPENSVQTLYRPAVTVTYNLPASSWRMSIAGLSDDVTVQRLTNVTRTAVDGIFDGFGQRKIFRMADRTWWRQTSSESSASTRSNPEIFIYNNYLEMPDEGLRVAAEKLNVLRECTITNLFAGLHYGNLYQLACGESWMQLCFENVRTNAVSPTVMLWMDGTKTSLLIRDRRNAIIGSCLVVNPAHDTDSDGLSNAAEVLAGFDPLDSQSRFELRRTDRCVLNWIAVEGRIYTIEWTPSLTENFQTLETGILWPQNSWTDTFHAVETRGYYRITVRRAE